MIRILSRYIILFAQTVAGCAEEEDIHRSDAASKEMLFGHPHICTAL
jgi:hypothetical protein